MGRTRPRRRTLATELARRYPHLTDPDALIAVGDVLVDGFPHAVDAGHGQLRGWLRQDPRLVNLERTNVACLNTELVPEPVELVTIDLSSLAIASAVPQLETLAFDPGCDLIALVKPAYALGLPSPPADGRALRVAVTHAADGLFTTGWCVVATEPSPVPGGRGAVEWLLHARRRRTRLRSGDSGRASGDRAGTTIDRHAGRSAG